MAGVFFWFQDWDVDVWSGRQIDLDSWRYALKAGGVSKARVCNTATAPLYLDNNFDFKEVRDFYAWVGGRENVVIFEPEWSCPEGAVELKDLNHAATDWYVFGPVTKLRTIETATYCYLPMASQAALHASHVATSVMLRRFEEVRETAPNNEGMSLTTLNRRALYTQDVAVLLVPKVASTSLIEAARHSKDWYSTSNVDTLNYRGLANCGLVRDPVDRWVSGMAELSQVSLDHYNDLRDEDKLKEYVDQGWHDQHTYPQQWFLDRERYDPTLFKLENIEAFRSYLADKRYPMNPVEPYNTHEKTASKKEVWEFIRGVLDRRPDYVDKLREVYADDVDLYEKAL